MEWRISEQVESRQKKSREARSLLPLDQGKKQFISNKVEPKTIWLWGQSSTMEELVVNNNENKEVSNENFWLNSETPVL